MATDEKVMNFALSRLMSRDDFSGRFLSYFQSNVRDAVEALTGKTSGVLSGTPIGMSSDGAANIFKFDIASGAEKKVVDGDGNVITLNGELAGQTDGIQFENNGSDVYEVGVGFCQVDDDPGITGKGQFFYQAKRDSFGELGNASSIDDIDLPNHLRFFINGLTDSNSSYAGRKARVWMTNPVSNDSSVAFYEGTIGYSSPNNYIDVPAISGKILGQDVASTGTGDYFIQVLGPRVLKRMGIDTLVKTSEDYAFMGSITAGTPTFDISSQTLAFLITLQQAYNGGGVGLGNNITINADDRPIKIQNYPSIVLNPEDRYAKRFYDNLGVPYYSFEQFGRMADVPRFKDDFFYSNAHWPDAAGIPAHLYEFTSVGTADVKSTLKTSAPFFPEMSGFIELSCGDDSGDIGLIDGPEMRVKGRRPALYATFALSRVDVQSGALRLRDRSGGLGLGFEISNATMTGYVDDGTTVTNTSLSKTLVADTVYRVMMVFLNNDTVQFWWDGLSSPEEISGAIDLDAIADISSYMSLGAFIEADATDAIGDHILYLDYWETWTLGNIQAFNQT